MSIEKVCHGHVVCFTKDEFYVTLARGSNHPSHKVMSETRTIKVMICLIIEDIRENVVIQVTE